MTELPGVTRFGALAVGLESCAAVALFRPEWWAPLILASVLHVAAAACCARSAYCRSGTWGVEHSAVAITALFVPLFGPVLGWMYPNRKDPDLAVNAHAYFERFEDLAQGAKIAAACLPDAGAFEATRIRPQSFAEILRHGSIAHKRNALTKLAELGQPRHLRMIRQVMARATGELRLCAFLELRGIARRFEDRIAEILTQLETELDPDEVHDLRVALAEQHVGLASSGLLDTEMARFHAERAVEEIDAPWQARKYDPQAGRTRARALGLVGEHEEALRGLEYLHEREQAKPEVGLIRAEIGYRMRDFVAVRQQADDLADAEVEVPEWLAVVRGETQDAPTEVPS